MKSFIAGLAAVLIIGSALFLVLRDKGLIPTNEPTPSPTPTVSNWDMAPETSPDPTPTPSIKPSATPTSSLKPTTKGGQVLGTGSTSAVSSTKIVTTTTEKTITKFTLFKSNDCPVSGVSEVKDLNHDLTIRYSLKDNYSARVTIWKENGEEVLSQREIKGSGDLITVKGLNYLKLAVSSADCEDTSDNWLLLTASN